MEIFSLVPPQNAEILVPLTLGLCQKPLNPDYELSLETGQAMHGFLN